jgi:hypothetical protein
MKDDHMAFENESWGKISGRGAQAMREGCDVRCLACTFLSRTEARVLDSSIPNTMRVYHLQSRRPLLVCIRLASHGSYRPSNNSIVA